MTTEAASAARPLSIVEINGRIAELQAQRDAAQSRCAFLAGQNAEMLDLIQQQRAELARLTQAVAPVPVPGEPAPATAP